MVGREFRVLRAADRGQAALHAVRPVDQSRLRGARHRGVVLQHRARRAAGSVRGVQHRRGRRRLLAIRSTQPSSVAPSLPTSGPPNIPPSSGPHSSTYFQSAREVALTMTEIFAVSARASGALVLAVRRSLDHDDARHPLRTSQTATAIRFRVNNEWARTPTTESSPCCTPSLSPACRSSPPMANGST